MDGAIFSASNAALMLAQMGEEEGAIKEVCACACVCKELPASKGPCW